MRLVLHKSIYYMEVFLKMEFVLGIDTGGTYTDSCLIDINSGKVICSSKALTNHNHLAKSVEQSLREMESGELNIDWNKVKQVSVSTTLATNSIVEGKGCRVGLILIGRISEKPTPASYVYSISGGHTNSGDQLMELIPAEIERAWNYLHERVDAFAVASYMGVRNPEHEIRVKEFLLERTDKPVVCAHQLSRELGFYERSVTAVLNAKILPLIDDLLNAVEEVFQARLIKAPIMVVKGDGTLFSLELARKYPIETVLSGPAASVIGACYLEGMNEATVVDMGGTTMDIAIIKRNLFATQTKGVNIGGWQTQVKTVHADSIGLGGDSHIQFHKSLLHFGPRRVIPISRAASLYPEIISELQLLCKQNLAAQLRLHDFLISNPNHNVVYLGKDEKELVNALQDHPLSIRQISEELNIPLGMLTIPKLEDQGIIRRISLTPTDLLHAMGRLNLWNSMAPRLMLQIFTDQISRDVDELAEYIYDQFILWIAKEILSRLLDRELAFQGMGNSVIGSKLLERLLGQREEIELTWTIGLKNPFLAVGAPAKAYFPDVARILGATLRIPHHMDVANAVGASIAPVLKQVAVLVRPYQNIYSVHSPLGKKDFNNLTDAVQGAVELAKTEIKMYFTEVGIENPEIEVEVKENIFSKAEGADFFDTIFLDAKVIVQGRGYPIAKVPLFKGN
jgi:N-methylhydantoinase A/oxoprolinase/acetone carboxylase beta subunit